MVIFMVASLPKNLTMADNIIREKVRVPPQNIEAEMALLGSIMLRPDSIYEVIDIITPKSFYANRHAVIFEGMLDLFTKRTPIDLLSLSSRLKEKNHLDQVGGASYLTELVNTVPSSANIKHYAEIVEKKHIMRRLIDASEYISHLGYDESAELEETLDLAEKQVYDITTGGSTHKFVTMKDELIKAWERLEFLHNNTGALGRIPTGFFNIKQNWAEQKKQAFFTLPPPLSKGKPPLVWELPRRQ